MSSADSGRSSVMTQPIHHLFSFLKTHSRIQIWLYDNSKLIIEGTLIGFDEFMNVVLDDAHELTKSSHTNHPVGRIMLKGDNIALVRKV